MSSDWSRTQSRWRKGTEPRAREKEPWRCKKRSWPAAPRLGLRPAGKAKSKVTFYKVRGGKVGGVYRVLLESGRPAWGEG